MSFGQFDGMPMLSNEKGRAFGGKCGRHIWQQANDAYCRQRRSLNLRQLGETRFGMGVLQALYAPWTTMKRDSGVIVRLGRIHWALRSCREKAATRCGGGETENAMETQSSFLRRPRMKHAAK